MTLFSLCRCVQFWGAEADLGEGDGGANGGEKGGWIQD